MGFVKGDKIVDYLLISNSVCPISCTFIVVIHCREFARVLVIR